jgi:hypothetical protein
VLLREVSSAKGSGLFPSEHASLVEEVAEHGGGICTAAPAFHAPTFERCALKCVPLVGVYAERRDSYSALRLSLAAATPA